MQFLDYLYFLIKSVSLSQYFLGPPTNPSGRHLLKKQLCQWPGVGGSARQRERDVHRQRRLDRKVVAAAAAASEIVPALVVVRV